MSKDCCNNEHKEGDHEKTQNDNDIIEDQEIVK